MDVRKTERLRALKATGYLDAVENWAKLCCAPVFWKEGGSARSGSMTLVNTGSEILGVTAGHVADAVMTYAASHPDGGCQVGAAELDPQRRLIARHKELDLATFRLSEPLLATAGHQAATALQWPPPVPAVGDLVLFGGYPGTYRSESERDVDFGFVWCAGNLESQSHRNIGMVLRIATSLSASGERIAAHADLGGWSGGSVFIVAEKPSVKELALLLVAGVIYEYSASSEIVLAHPLSHVLADGRL